MAGTKSGERSRRLTRPDLPRVEVYGDESLARGRFDLLGSLWIPAQEAQNFRASIASIRSEIPPPVGTGEMKWTKCSGARSDQLVTAVLQETLRRILTRRIRFKCIVIERALVDNDAWNDGDLELGFFKAWHTLLKTWALPGSVYHYRLDARNLQKSTRLAELQSVMNACGKRDFDLDYNCCGSVESRDSKTDDLIQVVDLLTGAVGFHFAEGHLKAGASPAKVATAAEIAKALRRPALSVTSMPSENRFNVWQWKPRVRAIPG